MFTDNSDKTTEATPTAPHYVLEDAWKPFFAELLNVEANSEGLSTKAYNYVVAMTDDSEALDVFAEAAKNYYITRSTKEANDPDHVDFDGLVSTGDAANNTVTFISLPAGSYVVFPESGSTSASRKTDAMFITIRNEDVTKAMKSVYPTVEKKVQTIPADGEDDNFQDTTTSKVGDYVQFQLTSKVPEMSDYDSYTFNFKDILSKGLTFVNNNTYPLVVKIAYKETVDEQDVTSYRTLARVENRVGDYDITVTQVAADAETEPPVEAHTDLVVSMVDLKSLIACDAKLNPDDEIIVTYYARINSDAEIGVAGNPNTATVEYSNDPSSAGTGESEPDTSKVYVYNINIFKFTEEGSNNIPLSGAKFKIKKTADGSDYIKLIRVGDTGSSYRVATAEEITEETGVVEEVTSPADGNIYISGLEIGTYYLEETEAPTGYNKLTGEIKVTLSMDDSTTTGTVENDPKQIYYSINGTQNENANDNKIPVENRQGSILPTTGGVGTIVLTIVGVGLVIVGIVLPLSKKKKKDSNS